MMIKYDKNQSKYFDVIIIYFCWNIRKEQNRSTFKQNKFAAKKSHNAIRTKMTSNSFICPCAHIKTQISRLVVLVIFVSWS